MATPPKKSSSRSSSRSGTKTSRAAKPKLTAVEGGASARPAGDEAAHEEAVIADVALREATEMAEAEAGGASQATLRKKVLLDRVVAASGAKKKDAKEVVEATLAVIGQALSDGEELNLPPLGKMRIVKSRDTGGAEVVTLKLRRPNATVPGSGQASDLAPEES